MVEVFKTDVAQHKEIKLLSVLSAAFPHCRINFDLEDSDKILRIEGDGICNHTIIELLDAHDCFCEVLE